MLSIKRNVASYLNYDEIMLRQAIKKIKYARDEFCDYRILLIFVLILAIICRAKKTIL